MKRLLLIFSIACVSVALPTLSASAMTPPSSSDFVAASDNSIVSIVGGRGHGRGHMRRGGRGHHYGWSRGRRRGWR